jgi:hypothetical protein
MLSLRRAEGEGRFFVLAVLGEVEVHPPDHVPGRVDPLEECLERGSRLCLLGHEGLSPGVVSRYVDTGGRWVSITERRKLRARSKDWSHVG